MHHGKIFIGWKEDQVVPGPLTDHGSYGAVNVLFGSVSLTVISGDMVRNHEGKMFGRKRRGDFEPGCVFFTTEGVSKIVSRCDGC